MTNNCNNCIHLCIVLDKVIKLPNGKKTTVRSDNPRMVCGRVKCEYKPRPIIGESSEPNSKSDDNKTDK